MSSKTLNIIMQVPVDITKSEDSKWFIACCPVFDVSSQGKSEKKALDNLAEALSLFFISCFERGTLDTVMKESGFIPGHPSTRKKLIKRREIC